MLKRLVQRGVFEMKKLILKEVSLKMVVEGESYLVWLCTGDFVNVIASGYKEDNRRWICEDGGGNITGPSVVLIFEAPRENRVFAD